MEKHAKSSNAVSSAFINYLQAVVDIVRAEREEERSLVLLERREWSRGLVLQQLNDQSRDIFKFMQSKNVGVQAGYNMKKIIFGEQLAAGQQRVEQYRGEVMLDFRNE